MRIRFVLTLALSANFFGCAAFESWTPVELAAFYSLQLFDPGYDVNGIRLSLLWGHNKNLTGVDIGLGANVWEGAATGLQFAGGANYVDLKSTGIQIAGWRNENTQAIYATVAREEREAAAQQVLAYVKSAQTKTGSLAGSLGVFAGDD